MDNRNFITQLARKTDMDYKEAGRLSESLCRLIGECLANGNDVALPGFGTFESVKTIEHVTTDEASGRKMLIPPTIHVEFRAGSRLKKAIAKL